MEAKKYISITYGTLKFSNGKKIGEGDFVPANVPDEDIREKLKLKQIAIFDNKIAAVVQASNKDEVDIVKKLKNEINFLDNENEKLAEENANVIIKNKELEKEIESLKDQLKKAGKK